LKGVDVSVGKHSKLLSAWSYSASSTPFTVYQWNKTGQFLFTTYTLRLGDISVYRYGSTIPPIKVF
jgi:hypothetical protein